MAPLTKRHVSGTQPMNVRVPLSLERMVVAMGGLLMHVRGLPLAEGIVSAPEVLPMDAWGPLLVERRATVSRKSPMDVRVLPLVGRRGIALVMGLSMDVQVL